MTRHKHADVIHAWAEGEIIQFKRDGKWVDYRVDYTGAIAPVFRVDYEYRVKPKIIKKEGWVNLYGCGPSWVAHCSAVFHTKEDADKAQFVNTPRKSCVRIEWEEEE